MLEQKFNPNSSNLEQSEQINAKQLKQILNSPKSLPRLVNDTGEEVRLSKSVHDLLYKILEAMAAGIEVTVSPIDRDITIAEAADILNVSADYMEELLERKEIPSQVMGISRHISSQDLLDYKSNRDINRREGIVGLTALMQETGCYKE